MLDLLLYVAWCLFLLESLDNTEYLYITVVYVIKAFLNAVFCFHALEYSQMRLPPLLFAGLDAGKTRIDKNKT
ncbi:hypothetical protein EE548_22705 [Salmonella enterica]|nr:hypothetical protein [Salmonella enterica]